LPSFYAYFRKWLLPGILVFLAVQASGQQVIIRGTVFNMYRTHPLEAVSVVSNSGRGTITDSNGNYSIRVDESDSLSFSFLGRSTQMFAVKDMNPTTGFDIALHVSAIILNEVRVSPHNYHMDSLQNRQDYEKSFDYRKPALTLTSPENGSGVGLDLDAIINMFKFRQTHRALAFQRRLIEDEQDKFVAHRFTPYIVKKITHLDGKPLDSFMVTYRPSYQFTKAASDYDFYDYIKLAYREFLIRRKNQENPDWLQKEN
jgi:hypothetical protein